MDIQIEKIRRDGGTQSRADIDDDVVEEYAEAMRGGAVFPPVTVFHDGKAYWLADGFHRVAAAEEVERSTIAADVRQGTQRDAILHSVGVNANHGLRRTNDDKRRAVEVLLRDKEWRLWSDREIARQAGVDHKTVGKWRSELIQSGEIPQSVLPTHVQMRNAVAQTDLGVGHVYSPEIGEDADVEAARQVAIIALAKWAADGDLDACLGTGAFSAHEGIFYRIGKGTLVDIEKTSHEVGEAQVAVALSSNNGTGVYRFDARQLHAWIEERAAFVKKPDVLNGLYNLLTGGYYISWSLDRDLIRLGLAAKVGTKTKISLSGRSVVDAYLAQNPKLMTEHEIRMELDVRGELGAGIALIETIYKAQKKSGNWVAIAPNWNNDTQRNWLKAWAAKGFLVETRRDLQSIYLSGSLKKDGMGFYIVTNEGASFIGQQFLQTPDSLPDLPYQIDAETFLFPEAAFTLKVGDVVKFEKKVGRVTELCNWPSFKVAIANQSWPETWYENKVSLVEVNDETPDPVVLAELDAKTKRVWDDAQALLHALNGWPSDENDQPQGMNPKMGALEALSNLMSWVADTHSGERLKLQVPAQLEEFEYHL